MRFLIIRRADAKTEAGELPGEAVLDAMVSYHEQLAEAGALRDGLGLKPSAQGARVTFSKGVPTVTDGPFTEAKELIAGFSIIDVPSLEDAVAWATRWPAIDSDGDFALEVRPVFEAEELGDSPALERNAALTRRLARPAGLTAYPYLVFDGACAEAFRFYQQVLGGTIEAMITHAGSPMAEPVPAEWGDRIMHACLIAGDLTLMGSDMPPGRAQRPAGFYVNLTVGQPAEAERIFDALADGGTVTMPLEPTFWAERFGMLVDRFGIPWMVNCAGAVEYVPATA